MKYKEDVRMWSHGITISLNVGLDGQSSSINASGNIIESISSHNIDAFGIGKSAITKVVLSNPKKYGPIVGVPLAISYKDVITTIDVIDAEILGITSQPIIVKTQEFINNSDVEGTFNVSITDSVSNTSTSTWSVGGSLTITQKVSYGLKFGASGETSMSYTQSWGIGGSESKTYTIGSTSGVTTTLKPGQAIIAQLSASRGVLKAKVNYNATCSGKILYMGSGGPLLNIPITEIMSLGNISNSIKSSETMEVGYYSNSRVEIKNKADNKLISNHYLG